VALELAAHARVVRTEQCTHVLRVETLGARGEADEVGEENGDDLALLARGRIVREARSARGAKPRAFGVIREAACGARRQETRSTS
jgi:hypothetical protein